MWQKSQNGNEGKQIQSLKMSNPTSPGGSLKTDECIELESLPHQSITEATQVHFGARPDLKSKKYTINNLYVVDACLVFINTQKFVCVCRYIVGM